MRFSEQLFAILRRSLNKVVMTVTVLVRIYLHLKGGGAYGNKRYPLGEEYMWERSCLTVGVAFATGNSTLALIAEVEVSGR